MGILTLLKLGVGLPKLLFKYWYIVGFAMFMLPAIVQSIDASIKGDDWGEPLREGGVYLASQDQILYDYVEDLEYNPNGNLTDYYFNFWTSMFWAIWKALWGLFFTFMILFKTIRWWLGDDSASMRAFIIVIIIMTLAQVLVAGIPFKGLYSLGEFIIKEVIL